MLLRTLQTLSLAQANQILDLVITEAAADGGDPIAVAVVGVDGRTIAMAVMDEARPLTGPIACRKAYTSAVLHRDTAEFSRMDRPPEVGSYGDPSITLLAGGVMVMILDDVVGAIGVSGRKPMATDSSRMSQDHELATNARDRFLTENRFRAH